ncbi:hypothetical protein QNH36_12020 [Mesobacillus sp. AQ2]|jgi:hypothetical protein|uniref:hypothetical protein n=1 Tax=Bacillaceae TaxID=186817 RepID=UPI0011A8E64B|nr:MULTISPECIES: hypothetical protein [Bacillaceae]MCM3122764.1 hypothetical protein [Mesobacillus sp. MER 33]MCM3233753.1 hypothetical protein [Mesobacillus sp. MER 48]WHX42805.1 hypothetical protein QNH36_12020 [Mesobacillus sp. AQ2]
MFVVHFFENRNELLNQLRQQVPSVGEDLRIKGRKGKVTSVLAVNEKTYHVHLALESKQKPTVAADPGKKKKR